MRFPINRECRAFLRWIAGYRIHRAIVVRAALLLSLLLTAWPASPQSTAVGLVENAGIPSWAHYTQQRDGLHHNDVRRIWAYDGGLWFGGTGGVSHYDGVWSVDRMLTGDAADIVTALTGDSTTKQIWTGTDSGLILHWDGQRWSQRGDLRAAIYALALQADVLWAATAEGLYRLHDEQAQLEDAVGRQPVYALLVDDATLWVGAQSGLWRYRDERWQQLAGGEVRAAAGILALARLPDGSLVAGVHSGLGIQAREGASWHWIDVLDESGVETPVQALAVGHDGSIWAGTNGAGAIRVASDGATIQTYGFTGDANLTTRFVRDIAVDRDGSVWFATPAGVFRNQAALWSGIVVGASDDVRNHVNALVTSRGGELWVATAGAGIRRVAKHGTHEALFTLADGALDAAFALAEDGSGAVWAGGFGGLRRYDANGWQEPIARERLPSPVVTSLLADLKTVWVGTEAGLVAIDPVRLTVTAETVLDGIVVESLAFDGRGNLWVGTNGSGIWRQIDGEWVQYLPDPDGVEGLRGDTVATHGLARAGDNPDGMWAAMSEAGLAYWDGQRWRMQASSEIAPSNLIWCLYTDPVDGALWIGSEAGVTRYDGITAAALGVADGLQSANIYAITGTEAGGYWFGGRTGLSHFVPEQTPPWLRITNLTGNLGMAESGVAQVATGDRVVVNYLAGDLQDGTDLAVFARLVGAGTQGNWQRVKDSYWMGSFDQPGAYQLDLMARDRSFNYSTIVSLPLGVMRPPTLRWVPVLGEVETGVFRALVVLGSMVVLGVSYMAVVVIGQRRRSMAALVRGYNPYISGEPVRRHEMFFGRRGLLQRIVDTLHNNSIMIYGERRIGKTTLLYQLVVALREVNDPEYWFVPIYTDLEGTPQEEFFHYLADEIVAGVEALPDAENTIIPYLTELRYHVRSDQNYSDRDFYRDLNRITEVLQVYGEEHEPGKRLRLILLIDEMDVMTKYDRLIQQQLRRIFMREFAETLGAVVAGIQISRDWDRVESPWFNMFNEIALTPFTREQAIELLVEPVRGIYQYELAALEYILEQADGRPYRLQQYGLEAVNAMLAQRRRRILLEDAEAAHEKIQATELDAMAHTRPSRMMRLIQRALSPTRTVPTPTGAATESVIRNGQLHVDHEGPLS